MVYSTCTLSPIQNESVIEKAAAMVKHNFGIDVFSLYLYYFFYFLLDFISYLLICFKIIFSFQVVEESLSDLFISLYNTGMYQVTLISF